MFARDRKEELLAYMRVHKRAGIHELSEEFHVTGATIRSDLSELEKEGHLIRTHGGALLKEEEVTKEAFLASRWNLNPDKKRIIAQGAKEFVREGDIILIDSGSTMLEFAKVLTDFNDLKVVTNDLNIALELQKKPSIQVILIGGTVRNQFECTFGSLGIEFLERISVDKLFLSPNALSVSKGLTTPNEETAAMKRAMMRTATEAYMLCDSTKIGRKTFCRFARNSDFKYLITDEGIQTADKKELEKQGIKVRVCKMKVQE